LRKPGKWTIETLSNVVPSHGWDLSGIEFAEGVIRDMRRVTAGIWGSPTMEGTLALIVTAAFFALGSLLGCFLALQAGGEGAQALENYLTCFLHAAEEGTLREPDLPGVLWRTLRWPMGAILLGFTALGLAGIPILSALRGFLLTFSVGAFVRTYGWAGARIAFCLLGITGLLSVPVFLFLAAHSFTAALRLARTVSGQSRKEAPPRDSEGFRRLALCAAALGVCILLERYLVPLWTASAAIFTTP